MLVSCAARLGSSDPRRSSSSTKVLKALVDARWLTPAEQLAEVVLDRTAAYDHVSFAELAQAWPSTSILATPGMIHPSNSRRRR